MRRKIVLSLLVLFLCSTSGAVLAVVHVRNTAATLSRLVTLHQVEQLRRHLIIAVQTAQSDLYTVHTALGHKADVITENVLRLEEAARRCSGCHHEPAIAGRLARAQALIEAYQGSLSYYITASANRERIERLQAEAARIGNDLLQSTEEMSLQASRHLERATGDATRRIARAQVILTATVLLTLLLGAAVAVHLIRAITRPIDALVGATRAISAGDLGYTLSLDDGTEFGELARNFNAMSGALRQGYAELRTQVEERRHAEEALRKSEERYALAARGANDGFWDWDLKANKVHYSVRWKSMLGYAEQEIGDDPQEWIRRVHPDDRAEVEARIAAHLSGGTPHYQSEHRILHADGTYLWVVCRGIAVRDESGRAYRIAGSQTDITARKRAEERLIYDAFHDALTGLPNRALFLDRLDHVLATTRRHREQLYAVLFLDLDRFKVINDSLGHLVGDHLLVAVGRRIGDGMRPSDTVARLGGDEFGVLLEEVRSPSEAARIAERIQEDLARSFHVDGHEIFVRASIGIAVRSERYERPEQVLRDADVAMYQAKTRGKGGYEIFDASMHGSVVERLKLEAKLRRAVEHGGEFVLHYQPVVELGTRVAVGVEALLRWNDPERGLVGPSDFVALAEESGMIVAIGEWVARTACGQVRSWRGIPALAGATLAINLSARQLQQPDAVDRLARVVLETGVDPWRIALEVTESAVLGDLESSAAKLRQLREMGMRVHVDDFGTGYSSLSYLHRLPVTAVKIDRSFVSRLGAPGESDELVRAILSIAESLDLETIAEGVEEQGQLQKLRELGCRFGQGYLFARPMEPAALSAWAAPQVTAPRAE